MQQQQQQQQDDSSADQLMMMRRGQVPATPERSSVELISERLALHINYTHSFIHAFKHSIDCELMYMCSMVGTTVLRERNAHRRHLIISVYKCS